MNHDQKFRLKAQPLTHDAFKPFGNVIETKGATHFAINAGAIERYHDLANIVVDTEQGGRPLISIARANKVTTLPVRISLLERHPRGSQAFIPITTEPMIIVVASSLENTIVALDLKAFVSNGAQGINYLPGTWHMPLMASCVEQTWLIVDRGGPGNNCEEFRFDDDEIEVFL